MSNSVDGMAEIRDAKDAGPANHPLLGRVTYCTVGGHAVDVATFLTVNGLYGRAGTGRDAVERPHNRRNTGMSAYT